MKYITQLGYKYAHPTIHKEDHWVQEWRPQRRLPLRSLLLYVGVNVYMNESYNDCALLPDKSIGIGCPIYKQDNINQPTNPNRD